MAVHSVLVDLWDVMPLSMPDPGTAPSMRVAPPTIFALPKWRLIFALPKWRLNELQNQFLWTNVITFAPHPLRRLAQTAGRSLTIMVKEAIKAVPFMVVPSLLGVGDMCMGLMSLDASRNRTFVRERDMDNCYWNIDKKQVLQ